MTRHSRMGASVAALQVSEPALPFALLARPASRPEIAGRLAQYEYPRYFFSNLSQDIRQIFCDHCDLLGIRWTQLNARNNSVSHRHSVALLDQFVGPKT